MPVAAALEGPLRIGLANGLDAPSDALDELVFFGAGAATAGVIAMLNAAPASRRVRTMFMTRLSRRRLFYHQPLNWL